MWDQRKVWFEMDLNAYLILTPATGRDTFPRPDVPNPTQPGLEHEMGLSAKGFSSLGQRQSFR